MATSSTASKIEPGAQKLREIGAKPVMGGLTSLDVICRESAETDIVIGLASAYGVTSLSYQPVMHIDNAALDAITHGQISQVREIEFFTPWG